ncbi:hypothetical protein [Nocardioides mangrovi]|uniref:Phage holin family protein n=1 Tax=Nocardioides mangrovi TaxID=2874580 RepID=A0ABS7UBB0_9ACTN|nr:hypothetical protein [Nocardioides mangrovi]MBZ5738278.1 hypothetical protein [Nocardioides mangrovi]
MAAVGVLVSGAVHLKLYVDWAHENDKVGPAFLLNAIAGLVIAILLLTWQHWVPPLLSVGFGLATLVAFLTAATVGLFGVSEGWSGWAVWTALISEVVAVVAGGVVLAQRAGRSGSSSPTGTATSTVFPAGGSGQAHAGS